MKIPFCAVSILTILLIGILCYANSLHGPFVFDDIGYIQGNIKIRDLLNLKDIWHSLPDPSRFIGMWTFALNYALGKYNVFGYHLFNLFIHLTNAVLVWWLVQCLGDIPKLATRYTRNDINWISFIAAGIFVAHPLQTEAVSYIAQRFASLATLFYLLSCCLYIKGRAGSRRRAVFLAGSALSALTGMFTKQIVMTLPVMILCIEFLFIHPPAAGGKRGWKIPWKIVIPICLFLLVVPALYSFNVAARFYPEGAVTSGSHRNDPLSTPIYLMTQFRVIPTYLRLFIFPIGQNLLYDFRSSLHFWAPKTLGGFVFLSGLFGAGIYLLRRNPLLGFGILWFFITLAVESSIIMIKHVIFEHRCYLPSFGFCLFVAVGLVTVMQDKRKRAATVALILLTLGYLTFQRNVVWQDDLALWKDGIEKSPHKSRPYMNLGIALMGRGQYLESIAQFTTAIKNNHVNYGAYSNRGTSYFALGRYNQALADFNKALEINPKYTEAYINRGNYYGKIKDYARSIQDYNKALELNPQSPEALVDRGNRYAHMGRFDLALKDYNQALAYSPKFAQALNNRGDLYEHLKDYDRALADYTKAIALDDGRANYFIHRGNTYAKKELWQSALADYNRALALSPNDIHAYARRASTYMKLKNYRQALNDFLYLQRRGVRINPKYLSRIKQLAEGNGL